MTTIIATRDGIYTDTLCSYSVPFKTRKHAKIGNSIYAGAGDLDDLERFFQWRREGGAPPNFEDGIDILEVCEEGIFIWGKKFVRLKINQDVYAAGSGAQYAMGALAAGCTPKQAITIAARLDTGTGLPIEFARLKRK